MIKYYKASGKFSPLSFLFFILLALIAFPLLGLIYAYCIWYIPFIYINFIIAAIFGFIVGFLVNTLVIGKGKVRNKLLAVLFGLFGGFIALYFHWSVWVDLVINAGESYGNSRIGVTVSNISILQVFALATDPVTLFNLISEIGEVGTWGIRSATVSGTFLYVIWIIELIIIVGAATLTISKHRQPFCENDSKWFEEQNLKPFNFIDNVEEMINNLGQSNLETIDTLSFVENAEESHSIFTLYTSNHNENYLTIENNKAKIDKDGKTDFDADTVIENILISKLFKEKLLTKE